MNPIAELTTIDYSSLFIASFSVLIGIKAIVSLFEWIFNKLGLETKWMREKREERELLIQTSQGLAALQERHAIDMEKHERDIERSDRRDEKISNDIEKLTQMFVGKEIDDMRWEINNFAIRVSEGKPCNKDSFKHCIHIYEKYEKILEDNNLENGEVEISMELINEAYKEKLKNGDF